MTECPHRNLWFLIHGGIPIAPRHQRIATGSRAEQFSDGSIGHGKTVLTPIGLFNRYQQIAARLWGQALQEGQLQRAQQAYQARRDELVQRLNALNHTALAVGEGLHLWLPVRSETAAAQLMAQRGWLVQGGEPFRLKSDPAIRVSLANVAPAQLAVLAQDLADAMRASTAIN